MKVARFGRPRLMYSAEDLFGQVTPGPGGQVITSIGSNVVSWASNIATIWVNSTTQVLGPHVNIANGSNTTVTVDMVGAVASNTIRIHATGGASFGSNATRVSEVSAGGASTDSSRSDHIHDGIGTITSSSSNTMQRGTWNLRPGTGIALALTDTDGDGEFDTTTIVNTGVPGPAGGGGGGASGYDLDTYTLDATYGDDFTTSSLSGIWTRRNFTSGAETYQLGKNATYMRIAMTSRAAGDGYFQTAPGGDWTFAMAFIMRYWPVNKINWSLCVVDSAGTGVGMTMHNSPLATMTGGITTYSTYSGAFQQNTSLGAVALPGEKKVWLYLRKASGNYFGAASFDGEVWGPETPAFASAITVDRVGMIVHPLGGIQTTGIIEVDWFNKIA